MIGGSPQQNRAELTPTAQRRMLILAGPGSELPRESEPVLRLVKEHRVCDSVDNAEPLALYDLAVADWQSLGATTRSALVRGLQALPRRKLLIVSAPMPRAELAELFSAGILTNCLTRVKTLDSHDFLVTCQKLLKRDIFGFDRYFQAQFQREEHLVDSSESRPMLLKKVEEFALQASGDRERIATRFMSMAEEFLTNALYNAPVDSQGQASFAQLPRSQSVTLPSHQPVSLRLGMDENRIGISVTDPFGTLSRERVLAELARCFHMDFAEVARKAGGAGVGLYTVFLSASHFIINLAPGRSTEMIGLIELQGSHRDFLARGTSFNIFQT